MLEKGSDAGLSLPGERSKVNLINWLLNNEPITNFYTGMRVKDFTKTLLRLSGPKFITAAIYALHPYIYTDSHALTPTATFSSSIRFKSPIAQCKTNKEDLQQLTSPAW